MDSGFFSFCVGIGGEGVCICFRVGGENFVKEGSDDFLDQMKRVFVILEKSG